ncbi:anhydro-N-acetylmuramic acid kinase [Ekhidna sp.]|uniref:anhydro-N-acetylmuramic acid kinase n=1 Tax=Ekhidna sp. TaxID=2608089 RepID=UPI003C7AEBC2
MKTTYSIIGGMAGSSMDGLDLSHVIFKKENAEWNYQLGKCETIPYDKGIYDALKKAETLSQSEKETLDVQFGAWIGERINEFSSDFESIDLVGVHGHTVIHQPVNKISWQLGRGDVIAKTINLPTVTEFRIEDILHGGQGAPLVPFGDFTLFREYDACLNLGGIANISVRNNQTAWDICPCNQVLNFFAKRFGHPYDHNGEFASQGALDRNFYSSISQIDYFKQPPPKSLPNNFISTDILGTTDPKDGLYTYCKIVSEHVANSVSKEPPGRMLITGGGALNSFLIKTIKNELNGWEIKVPEPKVINFKESLIFAFLALKRVRNEINVLATVTGASKDTSSGVIHLP